MAFNPQEQEIIRAGIASGKSQTEIVAALSSYRTGSTPRPVSTNQIDPRPFTQKLTDFVGMSKAADVTASHFARMGVGPGTAAENRAVIPAPTLKQNIGAGLQYGGLAFDAITTPLSVFNAVPVVGQAANAAINAFSGYLYETGQDLLDDEGYMEALKPGAITAASAVAGPLLYLGGKGVIAGGKGLMKGGGRVVGKGVDALRGVGRSPGIPPPSSGVISNVPTPTVPSKFDLADNKITYSKDGWKRNEVTETTGGVTKIVQEEEQVMDVSELPPDLRQRYLDALKGKELAKGTGIENAKNASDVFQKVVDDIAQHIGLTQPTKNIPQPGSQFADQGIGQVTDAVGDIGAKATSSVSPGGVLGTTGEFLGRVPRAIARGVDAFDEATARAARIAESSPVVQQAIKSNLGDDIINFTQSADQAMTEDALKMVRIAETTPDALVAKQNPADIAGQAAAKQYQIVERERRAVGQKIGDLTDELAAQGVRVDMKPAYRQAIDVLRANGMLPKVSGKIKFSTKKYTPQQQDAIQKLYDLAMQEKIMSPTQVHEMDQLFSKLQKELLDNGKISDVYVKVPTDKGTMIDVNIFKVFRQIFSDHLSTLSPEMKVANAEYRKLKNLVEDIEATLIKKGNLRTNADVDPAEYARTNLRRIFSDAASAADYKAIYNKLDKLSRELGYEGSRADTLSLFASKLRDLYPETIPKNSFQGGISTGIKSGLLDIAEKVLKTGAPDIRDQQKALRALLEDRANFGFTPKAAPKPKKSKTPTAKSEPESSVKDTTGDIAQEEQIVEKATTELQKRLRNNKQAGFFSLKEIVTDIANMFRKVPEGSFKIPGNKRVKMAGKQRGEVINEGDDWSNWGQESKRDRDWRKNRNRGMANFGAMAEDLVSAFKKKGDDTTRVGLSPVYGAAYPNIKSKFDVMTEQADELFAAGKTEEAMKLYDQVITGVKKTVTDKFKNTNIKIKFNGTGFGVYEGKPEPNIDFSARVLPEDEDLFHTIMTDLSEQNFNQKSFLTYKQIEEADDLKYGIVDEAKGESIEPHLTFIPASPLSLADISRVNKALADAGLQAMSIKEGGKRVDILNLTAYNPNYEEFIKQATAFGKNLDSQGVLGAYERGVSKVRFVGNKESGATTSYERNRRNFYTKNKGFIRPDNIESKVLDAIAYKPTISKKELESIVNSGEVSPTEKAVFREVLAEMKNGQMKAIEVQSRLRGKLLTLTGKESESYVNYGWDNAISGGYEGKAVVFDSNFKHGKGQNHYNAEGLFGHARFALTEEKIPMMKDGKRVGTKMGKVATIGELQSDFFQHDSNVDLFKRMDLLQPYLKSRSLELEGLINSLKREVSDPDIQWTGDRLSKRKAYLKEKQNELKQIESQLAPMRIQENLEHAKKYLDRYERQLEMALSNPAEAKYAQNNYRDMIEASKKTVAELEAEAKANPVKPDILREQFLNYARSNAYRQRLFEETIDYIKKTYHPDEIRIAKPSMVAKIEGYLSAGEDMAPYELPNGSFGRNAEDLTFGDEVGYLGEPYIVVGVQAQGRGWGGPPPTMIGIAPEDKVSKFRLSEHIDSEVEFRMEELDGLLKGWDDTQILSREKLEEISKDAPWPIDRFADEWLEDTDEGTVKAFRDKVEVSTREKIEENVWDDLRDIYGNDSVFSDERGWDPMVYVVQDNAEPEWFNQPSSYTPQEGALGLDDGPQAGREMLPDYMGVLDNYYELHGKIIPKYEQKIGQKFTDGEVEDTYGDPSGYASFEPDYSKPEPKKRVF